MRRYATDGISACIPTYASRARSDVKVSGTAVDAYGYGMQKGRAKDAEISICDFVRNPVYPLSDLDLHCGDFVDEIDSPHDSIA